MADTLERVRKLLVEHMGVDAAQVTPEASLIDDLGCDSLDIVELEMASEDEFQISFAREDGKLDDATTVAEMVAAIDKRQQA